MNVSGFQGFGSKVLLSLPPHQTFSFILLPKGGGGSGRGGENQALFATHLTPSLSSFASNVLIIIIIKKTQSVKISQHKKQAILLLLLCA